MAQAVALQVKACGHVGHDDPAIGIDPDLDHLTSRTDYDLDHLTLETNHDLQTDQVESLTSRTDRDLYNLQ